jgi:hypothetical protein
LFTRVTVLAWFESRFLTSIPLLIDLVAQSTTSLSLKVRLRALRSLLHRARTLLPPLVPSGFAHGLSRQQFLLFNTSLLPVAAVVAVMRPVVVAPVVYLLITVALL